MARLHANRPHRPQQHRDRLRPGIEATTDLGVVRVTTWPMGPKNKAGEQAPLPNVRRIQAARAEAA